MNSARLGEVVAALGGELRGDPEHVIARIAPLETAAGDAITFVAQARLRKLLETTTAGAVVLAPALIPAAPDGCNVVVADDPYLYFARLTQWWSKRLRPAPVAGVHPSAWIAPGARVAASASIGPFVVVEDGAVVGERVQLGAHCVIGAGSSVGADSLMHPRVTIAAGCSIGERCVFQSGAVIGADGFGIAPTQGRWERIEQLGGVRIGNDVDIGANSCVDRGALEDTVLEDGVKLDNQIQIGHNVRIGAHSAMAGCSAIAGSTTIGKHCTIGGAAMIIGHLTLADHVHISMGTAITRSIHKPGQYSGVFPFDDNASWEKNAATLRQLHALRERIRALERQIQASA